MHLLRPSKSSFFGQQIRDIFLEPSDEKRRFCLDYVGAQAGLGFLRSHNVLRTYFATHVCEIIHYETRLFKYIENFTTKK